MVAAATSARPTAGDVVHAQDFEHVVANSPCQSASCSFVSRRTPIAASFWVGSLHEFVGWFQGRVPLDHLPPADATIGTAAVSNGQFGIADEILCSAVPTDKVTRIRGCWGAH